MELNKWMGVGNLGKDATTTTTANGRFRAWFVIAVNRSYKNSNGEWIKETAWVPCVWWGKGAEAVAQYLVKGKEVLVEGRLRSFKDKDGNEKLEVEVQSLTLGESRGGTTKDEDFGFDDEAKDEVPF